MKLTNYRKFILLIGIIVTIFATGCVGQTNAGIKINVTTNLTGAGAELGGFCGASTNGLCNTDSDCVISGCSGQICQSTGEESLITTCEYRECYNREAFGVQCGCVNSKCMWRS